MTDKASEIWPEEWFKLQKKYWETWQDLASSGPLGRSQSPWSKSLDQWWQAVGPSAPDPVQTFYEHLIEQGKSYFQLTESLLSGLADLTGAQGDAAQWKAVSERYFATMKEAIGGAGTSGGDSVNRLLAFWELPMDTWQRSASVMSGLPGDLLGGLKMGKTEGGMDAVRQQFDRFLSVPGLGYTREHQEQYQTLLRLGLDYQGALEAYSAEFAKIASASVERFQARLNGLAEGERVDTLQALYNLWVDACEEAYAERVTTDEYACVHGRLVNSLMALKRHGRLMTDEHLGALNMPTREEMNTLQCRFQELRRELRAVKARLADAEARPEPRSSAAPARAPVRKKAAAKTAKTAPPAAKKAVRRPRKTATGAKEVQS